MGVCGFCSGVLCCKIFGVGEEWCGIVICLCNVLVGVLVGGERGVCLRVFILLWDLVMVDKLRCFRAVSEYKKVVLCWDGEEGWVYGGAVGRVALVGTNLICWMGVACCLCFCVLGRLLFICRVS